MVKALADRFAEALLNIYTSKLERIFGVYPDENLSTEAMIDEVYKGISSPPGYPVSRPFRKPTIWKLLNVAEEIE
jgi:5-methyltetrahydrofolate--homocysteine methyltransferase